jgi:hypothetical protein
MSGMIVRSVTLRQARSFVQEHHRHHDKPQRGLPSPCSAAMISSA